MPERTLDRRGFLKAAAAAAATTIPGVKAAEPEGEKVELEVREVLPCSPVKKSLGSMDDTVAADRRLRSRLDSVIELLLCELEDHF